MKRMLFILVVAVVGDSQLVWAQAQTPALTMASVTAAAPGSAIAAEPETSSVRLLVGRSTVVDVGTSIVRVSLTSPDIADALVTSPSQLLINGKMPGTISMFVWDRAGAIRRYELVVQRDLSRLNEQLHQLFPGEAIAAQSNGKDVVLSGLVSTKDVADKAVNLAGGYVDKKEEVVSLVAVQPGVISNQVLLRVRFAEVSRTALTELGASFFTGANGYKNITARATTEQNPAPTFDSSDPTNNKLVFSDFLNLFLFDAKHQLGTVIKALQTKGLFQSLAEPNLVAESGKEASFLAGGEFPIPIAQPSGGTVAVTVVFKEFGVRLTFTPTVFGNRIHLKVKPEVSTLDFANAVTLGGFRIPALTTRRTETELELEDGQTFAIAGLMNNTVTSTMQKIPGIGDVPILGLLFRSKAAQKDRTELVVMITPEILRRDSPGVTPNLPRGPEEYLPALPQKQTTEAPAPAFRSQEPTPTKVGAPVATVPTSAGPASSAEAARAVVALTPAGPKRIDAPVAAPAAARASAASPGAQAPDAVTHPLTSNERKVLDRARRLEREQELAAKATEAKRVAQQAKDDADKAAKDKKQQDKLALEQAKHDKEAAKRAEEAAKKQAEVDRRHQKAVEEAQAKLKAAQAWRN